MSDFPASKKTFTALVDGTTYMEAVNVNTAYDEVEAIQTFLGASGAAQSHNLSVLEILQENYVGLRCYKKDDDEIYVGVGAAIIANAAGSVKKLRSNASVYSLSASGLDTGALAVDFYYIYAVADTSGTDIDFVFSLSDSAPTGCTHYKKIGWFYNGTASALDVAAGFIGNIKNGTGSPNVIEVEGDDDISTTESDYTDMTDMMIKFVSNGRPVEINFSAPFVDSSGNPAITIDIDGTDYVRSTRNGGSGDIGTVPLHMIRELAAGEHTIKVQWKKVGTSATQRGSTDGQRVLSVKEL